MQSSSHPSTAPTAAGARNAGARPTVADYVPSGFPAGGGLFSGAVPTPAGAVYAGLGARPSPAATATAPGRLLHGGGAHGTAYPRTDTAAAAEWRALYGASADMMHSTARTFRAGGAGVSYMTPIFHLTAHDATILAMEHNNHCKLLAISTSKNEILVTWTQLMPVIENMGVLRTADDDLFGGEQVAPVDERLLEWDPATMSILIDELPHPCTGLQWAPWQQGIYLAGLCPGHGIRLYRYSHGHWALDDYIRSTESSSCDISANFTVACACSRGRVELWVGGATSAGPGGVPPPPPPLAAAASAAPHLNGTGATGGSAASGPANGAAPTGAAASAAPPSSAWVLSRTLTLPIPDEDDAGGRGGVAAAPPAARHRPRDILGVGWDESATLLAAGDQGGAVYVIAATQDSSRLGEVVYQQPASGPHGPCKQVAWSPSSGRSYLSLAMVFATCVRLVLFRRPRFMNAAGLPQAARGGVGGVDSRGAGPHSGSALQVLASAQVPCEEVAKLSWNNTGTRFVTAHLDSSVNIWAIDVRYQHPTNGVTAAGPGGGGGSSSAEDGGADKRLALVVSVRRTSAVHPYHAVSK